MLKPLGRNVLVKRLAEEKKGTLIITPTSDSEPFKASVIDIGYKDESGVAIGDTLLLVPFSGSRISKDEDGLLLVTERDMLGVVNG
jgi:co-chaperonin GroES (HSP10)